MSTKSDVYELADSYVERFAALDPLGATGEGITGHDHEMTDYSPDGIDERAPARPCHAAGARPPADITNDADRIAAGALRERLELPCSRSTMPANACATSAFSGARCRASAMVFDLMPRDTEAHWRADRGAARARCPFGLSSIETAHTEGVRLGIVAARRQTEQCARAGRDLGGAARGHAAVLQHPRRRL